jgi:hypothetical protein
MQSFVQNLKVETRIQLHADHISQLPFLKQGQFTTKGLYMELQIFCIPSLQAALPHVSLPTHIPVTDVLGFLLPDEMIQGHRWLAEGPLLDSPSRSEGACQNDIHIFL